MKIRNGFVSNSSSSSFVIAAKANFDKDKLKKIVRKAVLESYMLQEAVDEITNELIETLKMTEKEIVDDQGYDSVEELINDDCWPASLIQKARKKGLGSFGIGSADSQGESWEQFFCDIELNYEDDDLVIEKDGGY